MSLGQSLSPSLSGESPRRETGVRRTAAGIALYLLLGALTLSPLLCATVPPLVDYPNHLARMWILLHAQDISALANNYATHWRLLPNLAMDLVVPSLAQIMPIEQAGRLFIALAMALPVLATAALHRTLFGRVGLWPLCALLFVYNAVLFWGFLNFLFAQGLALLAFSGWVASERWRTGVRLALFSFAAALLLIMHLFAFGIYGLLIASYEIGKPISTRRWSAQRVAALAARLAQFAPAALLWLASLGNGGPSVTRYGGLYAKLYAMLAPVTFDWWPLPFDLGIALAALLFLLYARRSSAFMLSPLMRTPIAVMITAAVLMPNLLMGSWQADIRLPATLPFILIASTRLKAPRRGVIVGFAAIALALLGTRLWLVSQVWRDTDRHFAEFRAASRAIPEGARLLVVQAPMNRDEEILPGISPYLALRVKLDFYHMPQLAIIDRSAYLPYHFVEWTPVRASDRNADGRHMACGPLTPKTFFESAASAPPLDLFAPDIRGDRPYCFGWPQYFDYVLWIDFDPPSTPPMKDLELRASGSFFRIYRIVRS